VYGLEEEELSWEDDALSVLEINTSLQEAIRDRDWWAVIDYADLISYHFPQSPFAQDSAFIAGEAYFHLNQLELANESFTAYLNYSAPQRFEEAVMYKFAIAEEFKNGAKKPLFGSHKLPKWLSAKEDAIKIYDDVIVTLPHHEIAIRSFLNKAILQAELEDYKLSLETLDLLIRKFPKHELAAAAYLEKSHVYLMQCKEKSLDPSLLDLADVNLTKFKLAFPREERLKEAEEELERMKEFFADHLLQTGKFFEKTGKAAASLIYYHKVVANYPSTQAAAFAKEKIESAEKRD
jgi:outer membrane protein assembly factor BamD (BamD/ComL family)